MNDLWIVGKNSSGDHIPSGSIVWEFQGVFSSRDKAVKACRSRFYFIAPATLDEEICDQHEPWPGCEYPLNV